MAPSAQYKEYVLEQLQSIGPVRASRFFGGVGLYREGVQFAMVIGNCVYFVVDDATRQRYEQVGMQAFSYLTKNGRIQVRRYFQLPQEILEDIEQLRVWAIEATAIAKKSPAKKSKPRRI
jgi:DNA transformation protein and related proteins